MESGEKVGDLAVVGDLGAAVVKEGLDLDLGQAVLVLIVLVEREVLSDQKDLAAIDVKAEDSAAAVDLAEIIGDLREDRDISKKI